MSVALFFLAQLAIPLFGLPIARHPEIRALSPAARCSALFGAGALFLTLFGLILSLYRIPWTVASFLLLLVAVTLLARRWPASPGVMLRPRQALEVSRRVRIAFVIVILAALGYLAFFTLTGRAVSPDFAFIWGLKGIRFAEHGGIDPSFLSWPYAVHTHVNYPPLFTTTLAWSAMIAGDMPWMAAPLVSAIWIAATIPLLVDLFRRAVSDRIALAASAFWTAAICISLVATTATATAEAPLLHYGAVGCAALLVRTREDRPDLLALLALTGLLMTKLEGAILFVSLLAGAILASLLLRRLRLRAFLPMILVPLLPLAVWWLYEFLNRIPMTDPAREKALAIRFDYIATIARTEIAGLDAGTFGLSWVIPLLLIAVFFRSWRRLLPALAGAAGMWLFLTVYFLHATGDPSVLIGWTFPRLMQSALSLVIVAAVVAPGRESPAAVL
ncbi:MAG TPA: glycosyltransferase family 39 protein [Thermoanaerobaculia bacterium]|nr:glycosyltransferase family 39 protein [Thermoanaerobaculia bacterium]